MCLLNIIQSNLHKSSAEVWGWGDEDVIFVEEETKAQREMTGLRPHR